ncbi:MAG: response regulator transcription factor [Pseudomonadota bacterium]
MTSTVIIADDHPLFREALMHAIRASVPGANIVEAESLATLQDALAANPECELLLLDLNMPGVSGFSALAYVRSNYDTLPTVIVSAADDAMIVRRAIQHGASGFISKSSSIQDIEGGIQAVLQGELQVPAGVDLDDGPIDESEQAVASAMQDLTPHQFRVLMMLTEGLLNKQIAYELGVSEATIKAHITAVFRKLKVNNRTQAVLAVQKLAVSDPAALELSYA